MREDIPVESVDLIYLDPPFNSKRLYNASMGGAQWVAFKDTWRWSEAVDDFHDVAGDNRMADTMEGLRLILGEGSKLAYLSYMANRVRECWRVLKPTGSLYLHCDPTMNYLLRVILEAVSANVRGGGGTKSFGATRAPAILSGGSPGSTIPFTSTPAHRPPLSVVTPSESHITPKHSREKEGLTQVDLLPTPSGAPPRFAPC